MPHKPAEVLRLNQLYGSPLSAPQVSTLHELLGGHPFLTQDAFYQLGGPAPVAFGDLVATAAKDNGPFGDHLRAMLSNLMAAEGLQDALRQVIKEGRVRQTNHYYRLEGAGLVRKEGMTIVPTTRIYRDFFRELT